MKRIFCTVILAVALASCAASDIEYAALGSAKTWCRNSPQYCSVQDGNH